ncbi:hypothetical protein EYF80_016217 [Liparis tanakae]|uniref:Uncharacterized protein n=1 Tax=Liparis tanakae TaxID=230148 RepID=A0A4Z2I8C2_9TELE|nr:hypothetical protein EYF80_016217 [Liparis tanakae]
MAELDMAVFLMTVGDSSPVNTYNNAQPPRMPNLPTSTRIRGGGRGGGGGGGIVTWMSSSASAPSRVNETYDRRRGRLRTTSQVAAYAGSSTTDNRK